MAQQRPNIASKWPNISPKPTQNYPQPKNFRLGVFFFGPKAASRTPNDPTKAQHSPQMAQQRPNITSKWPNISPKPTQKKPDLGVFFWAWKPPAEPQVAQHSLLCWAYVEPMFGQKKGSFYALNQRPKEPHCFWVMSGRDMRELRHLCGHSQPDFGEWVGLEPSISQKSSLIRCCEKNMGRNQRRRLHKICRF